jgi:hypothetical protein
MNDKIDFTNTYATPAQVQDFPYDQQLQDKMDTLWDQGLDAANQASTVSNPWTATNQAPCDWYVNRREVNFPLAAHIVEPVFWTAFPNRLKLYFSQTEKSPYAFTDEQVFHLADFGDVDYKGDIPKDPSNDGLPFKIPSQTCPQISWEQAKSDWKGYDPYGPRGWLDEYCEWAVTRNQKCQITNINFTCENPEYWYTLWKVEPQKVADLYNELLGAGGSITVEDLQLKDSKGNVVTDPFTGDPAYNPLNKWNTGTIVTDTGGGAVHLTSPPNTIGAEILLASQATLLRDLAPDNYNMQSLVCAGAFGRPYRNSDPHIGLQVNQVIKNVGVKIMLTNPLGLYIQAPDFSNYTFPDGTNSDDWFSVVRGRVAGEDGESYDQILHMKFHAPIGYTLDDVTIGTTVEGANGPSQTPQPIKYAGQIADTFKVAIAATAVPQPEGTQAQTPLPSVGDKSGESDGYPSMIIGNQVFEAMNSINANPPFVALPVYLQPGKVYKDILMQVSYISESNNVDQATIEIYNSDGTAVDPNVTVTLNKVTNFNGTPVGGGSGSSGGVYNFYVTLTVASNATSGLRGVFIKNPASTETPTPLPGLIYINA